MRKHIKSHPRINILIFILIALAVIILIGGYKLNWSWTGFTGEKETYRMLYDWLQLLFIPVVLAVAGFWFNHRERKAAELRAENEQNAEELKVEEEQKIEQQRAQNEREISEDNQREAALQEYINKMSDLLLHEKLRKSEEEEDEVRNIARMRTLSVLPRLDPKRKGSVIKLLYDSGLIYNHRTIINLKGADISEAYLRQVNLCEANLSDTNLKDADFMLANLDNANLSGAYMSLAKLKLASMTSSCLHKAALDHADLTGAKLVATNFTNAYLEKANLRACAFPNLPNLRTRLAP